jgi:rubredoxin
MNQPEKQVCTSCGYIYDPARGVPGQGVPPGTPFDQLPGNWQCPICYAGRDAFDRL